ncbi:MAG TPA: UDP-N-acetylmuramate--L-alanine ligase [Coxiellaceae bacterium]|nr:UDP-N-acetylmuramate--L-alanine ligase [Coxiellaceae bacterium]
MLSKEIRKIHCIGVGGIGVSGIAEFLLNKGYEVSGSDKSDSKITQHLREIGVQVYSNHAAEHVVNADLIVYSSAIHPDNPEIVAAKAAGIPLLQRAEMLAELMRDFKGIAVSGTHGKTTTTSLIAAVLLEANLDPSFMIGGHINNRTSPMYLGQGEYFVAEADESDASFLLLNPEIAVVNNIEVDHMETYGGDFAQLKNSFLRFLERLPKTGFAILGTDDSAVCELIPKLKCAYATFGFNSDAQYRATHFKALGLHSEFVVTRPKRSDLKVVLNIPGRHNVLNALAAIAVADHVGVPDELLLKALAHFSGVGRRFHARGELKLPQGSALIIDDYGHHPGAIAVTLDAARSIWPERRIVLAFQPHRYSRTQDLVNEFAVEISKADLVICLEIYSAGEAPIPGVTGKMLADTVTKLGQLTPIFVPQLDQLPETLQEVLHDQDILILQGAGDIGLMALQLSQDESL